MSFAAGVCAPMPALELVGHRCRRRCLLVWGARARRAGHRAGAWLRGAPDRCGGAAVSYRAGHRRGGRRRVTRGSTGAARAAAGRWARGAGRRGRVDLAARRRPGLIPPAWCAGLALGWAGRRRLTLGVSASPLLVSTGVLVGPRAALSMALGALLAWAGLGAARRCARAGRAEASYAALVPVLLWPGLALLVGSALTHLALAWPSRAPIGGRPAATLGARAAAGRRHGRALALASGQPRVAAGGGGAGARVGVGMRLRAVAVAAAGARAGGARPVGGVGARRGRDGSGARRARWGRWCSWALGGAGVVPSLGGGRAGGGHRDPDRADAVGVQGGPAAGGVAARAGRWRSCWARSSARRWWCRCSRSCAPPTARLGADAGAGGAGLEGDRRGRAGRGALRPPAGAASDRRSPPLAGRRCSPCSSGAAGAGCPRRPRWGRLSCCRRPCRRRSSRAR